MQLRLNRWLWCYAQVVLFLVWVACYCTQGEQKRSEQRDDDSLYVDPGLGAFRALRSHQLDYSTTKASNTVV
jgi:hypothetical protein